MNEHLAERFGRSRRPEKTIGNSVDVLVLPQALNPRVREYFDPPKAAVQGGAWLQRPEVPSSAEVLDQDGLDTTGSSASSDVVLPVNKKRGPWASKEDYLSTHYELLREDAIRALREAVSRVRMVPAANEDSFNGAVGIYEKVHICGFTCSMRGFAIRVTFSLRRVGKLVRWEQSKRLITGGLVVLTPADDMFKSKAIVAVVAGRPIEGLQQNPPEVDLFIARPEELEIDPAVEWVMVEDRGGLYEANRHTLLALQKMMRESFPLSEHLIELDTNISTPEYVQRKPKTDMRSVMHETAQQRYHNIDIVRSWPTQPKSDLDASQLDALKRILTKRLAIVQGPPGTGKTHVSVRAIKVMFDNRKEDDPPIIVACQTNHAVDQLLRHIAKFEPDFVRLGGRSKDQDVIKSRTLFEVRKLTSENPPAGNLMIPARKKMKDVEKEILVLLSPLTVDLTVERKPLDFRFLQDIGVLTEAQADSLETGASRWVQDQLVNPSGARSPFTVWLGKNLIPVAQKHMPEDFGFDYEEADLEMEQLKEMEAENVAKDDEDFETLRGDYHPLGDGFTSKNTPGITEAKAKDALKAQDLWKIPEPLRPAVYRYLQRKAKEMITTSVRQKTKAFDEQTTRRRIGLWERDEPILKKQKVIGMTTTGLSKYRGLISSLQPKVVLIEEAAETLEAPVTVACIPSLEQLILVGDHLQLRPHCHVKAHEDRPYYLNVSLFERMVNNSMEFTTLSVQRRMIPEIRRVLYPIYRNKITDHSSVRDQENRPDVPGMGGVNSWFFTHQWAEQRDEQMSAVNPEEAEMIVGFFEYLIWNGMQAEDITILTFYNGQRKRILSDLRNKVSLTGRRFNVVTVDSYQGEENTVAILSLVRSNNRGQIGFLNIDNRVCVALSRAQCGFYIFGNATMYYADEQLPPGSKETPKKVYPTWAKVIDIMANSGKAKSDRLQIEPTNRIDDVVEIRCANHGNAVSIQEPADWDKLHGGCSIKCDAILACGHPCELKCHPFPHELVRCQQECGKKLRCCGRACEEGCAEMCSCKVCSRHPVPNIPPDVHDGFDGTEQLSQAASSGRASSTESWNSFAREEPIRYAEALSLPVSQRESPVKGGTADNQPVRNDSHSKKSLPAEVDKKLKGLTLDVTAANSGARGSSPVTAKLLTTDGKSQEKKSYEKEDVTPSQQQQQAKEELLINLLD